MNLEARKIVFVKELLRLQNEDIVGALERFLQKRKVELIENSLKPMTMEEYDAEIDLAMDDSKNGRMIELNDLKAKIENGMERHSL